MEPSRKFPILAVLFIAAVSLAACGPPSRVVDLPMPPVSTGTAVTHAVSNGQLREVMRSLGAISFERLPQELDDPSRERADLQQASALAQDLALDADRIGVIVDQIGLGSDQRQIFLELARRLRNRALQLREQADLGQTRLINATMGEINNTCAACHSLFRDGPQPSPAGAP